jgi:hypothetical protein
MSLSGRAPLSSALANVCMRPSGASPGAAQTMALASSRGTGVLGNSSGREQARRSLKPGHRALRRTESVSAALPRKGPSSTVSFNSGLDGEDERTLEQIGHSLDLTCERVRQICAEALDKLNRATRARARHVEPPRRRRAHRRRVDPAYRRGIVVDDA